MGMTTMTKQFVIEVFGGKEAKKDKRPYFFDLAKKHIVKTKKGVSKFLSRDIDKILYGAG